MARRCWRERVRRVWVTRAQPGAEATAERVRAMGFEPVVAPLLETRPLAGGAIDLAGVAALAFTSAQRSRRLRRRGAHERDLPVFAVGAATAAAARTAGFGSVVSADGDVEALVGVIAAHGPFAGEVLHAGPTEPAGDLTGALKALGARARALAFYETVERPPDAEAAALVATCSAVLLHSPKASRVLAGHLTMLGAPGLTALCLSANVAAPLRELGLAAVRVAPRPTRRRCSLAGRLRPGASMTDRPRLFTRGFWAMMALAVLSFLAAAAVMAFAHHTSPAANSARISRPWLARQGALRDASPPWAALAQPVERRIRNA